MTPPLPDATVVSVAVLRDAVLRTTPQDEVVKLIYAPFLRPDCRPLRRGPRPPSIRRSAELLSNTMPLLPRPVIEIGIRDLPVTPTRLRALIEAAKARA
jgi:hypothetical protein